MTDETTTTAEEFAEPIVTAILLGDENEALQASIEKGIRSQRIIGPNRFSSLGGQIESPPFNIEIFSLAPDLSTRLRRSIEIMAKNTVGFGWEVVPMKPGIEQLPQKPKEQIETEVKLLSPLFKRPNPEMPFETLMEVVVTDLETLGNGYIEVVRNQNTDISELGTITELWHIQSATVRIRRDGDGFVQIKGGKKKFFKVFGDKTVVHADTGHDDGPIPLESRATELVHLKIYSPGSDFYGVPRWLAASPSISGARLAAIRNVSFFENDTVPRGMLLVSGGSIQNESIDMIKQFFRFKGRGAEKSHRVVVIQVEGKRSMGPNQPRTTIEWVPVTVGVTEDASFLSYTRSAHEEIREAFGIARIFYTEEETNRAGGVEARSITNDQVFEPERCKIEGQINNTIVRDFGVELTKLQFVRPKLIDPLTQAKIDQVYSRTGALVPNEIRARSLDLLPYPDELGIGDVPIQLSIVERQLEARARRQEDEDVDVGAVANEPPGGPQDLDRELGRDIAEIMARLQDQFGDEIEIRLNGRGYKLDEIDELLFEAL